MENADTKVVPNKRMRIRRKPARVARVDPTACKESAEMEVAGSESAEDENEETGHMQMKNKGSSLVDAYRSLTSKSSSIGHMRISE